jgi:hypothetical protein
MQRSSFFSCIAILSDIPFIIPFNFHRCHVATRPLLNRKTKCRFCGVSGRHNLPSFFFALCLYIMPLSLPYIVAPSTIVLVQRRIAYICTLLPSCDRSLLEWLPPTHSLLILTTLLILRETHSA